MKIKHFINLTNGIEFIPYLNDYEFIRIQSTTIEQKNWIKLFSDLDHNFIMNLVLGNKCHVYDCGSKRLLSKTIYLGVPLINYVLSKYFEFRLPYPVRASTRGVPIYNEEKYYNEIFDFLFVHNRTKEKTHLIRKIKYYKKFLHTDRLYLIGHSMSSRNDDKHPFFAQMIKNKLISSV